MTNQITKQDNLLDILTSYISKIQTKKGVKPSKEQTEEFITLCQINKLNPFKKQAYLVGYDSKNGSNFNIIIGIDGFRKIAHSTGQYVGREATIFNVVDNKLLSATVTVKRQVNGVIASFTATVWYSEAVQKVAEYVQGQPTGKKIPTEFWAKRPYGQLDKCAEASALRMAFPDDFSGVYTDSEIEPQNQLLEEAKDRKPPQKEQIDKIEKILKEISEASNITYQDLLVGYLHQLKVESLEGLTVGQANNFITVLEDHLVEAKKRIIESEA